MPPGIDLESKNECGIGSPVWETPTSGFTSRYYTTILVHHIISLHYFIGLLHHVNSEQYFMEVLCGSTSQESIWYSITLIFHSLISEQPFGEVLHPTTLWHPNLRVYLE